MKPTNLNPIPTTSIAKKLKSRSLLTVLAIVALSGTVAGYLYHMHQVKQSAFQADKARFVQVEANMKIAYDAMVAQAGVPDISNQEKGCGRPNLKFAKGNLSCGVTYTYGYAERDILDARTRAVNSQQATIKTHIFKLVSQDNAENLKATNDNSQSFQAEYNSLDQVSCRLHYTYDNPKFYDNFKTIVTSRFSLYQFSCAKDMNNPIYPLAK